MNSREKKNSKNEERISNQRPIREDEKSLESGFAAMKGQPGDKSKDEEFRQSRAARIAKELQEDRSPDTKEEEA